RPLPRAPATGRSRTAPADAPYGARQALLLLNTRALRPRVAVFREAGLEARASSDCRVAAYRATVTPWLSPRWCFRCHCAATRCRAPALSLQRRPQTFQPLRDASPVASKGRGRPCPGILDKAALDWYDTSIHYAAP